MNDLNKVVLIGRLTRDAELKYTNSGLPVARFSIAVNRRKKSGENWVDEANFFDVVQLGKGAEAVSKYLTKGKQICVDGELHQDKWEKEGQQRSRVEIVASNIQLLGGGTGGPGGPARSGAPAREAQPFNEYSSGGETESANDFEDDIPF